MGANAQTTVPTFTTGQVLTADQQNQSARTGVPVFATTTTRDAGFGSTGQKTLAEGQLCYLESTNVVQYYDGAAWATVGPQTLSSGLNYITGAAFTTVTSVSLPNSTFTSTYRNYKIILQLTAVTSDADFTARLRASGSDNTTSNYQTAMYGGDTAGVAKSISGINQTSFNFAESDAGNVRYVFQFDILAPEVATNTYLLGQTNYVNKANTVIAALNGCHHFSATTQFDSFTFISSVASSITGIYRVYGYADS